MCVSQPATAIFIINLISFDCLTWLVLEGQTYFSMMTKMLMMDEDSMDEENQIGEGQMKQEENDDDFYDIFILLVSNTDISMIKK